MELVLSLGLITRRDEEEEILLEDQDEEDERSFNDLQLRLQPSALINPFAASSSSSSKLGFPWAKQIINPSRGLDVNVTPSTSMSTPGAEDGIPRAVTGSPSSTLPSSSNGEDDENGNSRKKLRLSKEQSAFLEESFKEHTTLNPKQKVALAKQLSLRPRQVEVWFQNRRARTKLKQTEVDCEYLKRCCETLTEENRRLQKELSELRALRTRPHPFCANLPATTLSMCPSCEKTTTTPTTTANGSGNVHPHANSNSNSKAGNTSFGSLFASAKPGFYPFAHRPATSPAS